VELEPRTTAPAHATGAVSFVPLSAVSDDPTFRLREEGDVGLLAASIGRLGQLAPIELRPLPAAADGEGGPRYQIVAGFRRLAALRMLMRERVLARVHDRLDDDDAWAIALTAALVDEALVRAPVDAETREAFDAFLRGEPLPSEAGGEDADEAGLEREAAADEAEAAAPEDDVEVTEVTPEELVEDLARRMWEVNQDLALAAEAWRDLPAEGRRQILSQGRWAMSMLAFLTGDDE